MSDFAAGAQCSSETWASLHTSSTEGSSTPSTTTPASIEKTMDQSYFQHWQRNLHKQTMDHDVHMVPDSISPFLSQAANSFFLDSQSQHVLSNEEFQQVLDDPPTKFQGIPNPRVGSGRFLNGSFSCPPMHSNSTMAGATAETATEELHRMDTQKRPSKKSIQKKAKKSKVTVTLSDDEGEGEGDESGDKRWTFGEVSQLISLRAEMDGDFESKAKKQGVHMWDRLQEKMIAACDGFNKSAEACRKKWKTVYRQYCTDKRILQVSGEGRKVLCKWFDEIDQGFNNRANVRKLCHGDARGTPNPCPLDLNEPGEENVGPDTSNATESDAGFHPPQTTPPPAKASKIAGSDLYTTYMGDMVNNTSEIAKDIRETTGILKELKESFNRLVDKL